VGAGDWAAPVETVEVVPMNEPALFIAFLICWVLVAGATALLLVEWRKQ
jgi:hypothetical protein